MTAVNASSNVVEDTIDRLSKCHAPTIRLRPSFALHTFPDKALMKPEIQTTLKASREQRCLAFP